MNVYPLDAVALYVLPPLSARIAQNERTLFHFLLGQEPGCLCPAFLERAEKKDVPFVRVFDLFDYFSDLMLRDTGVGGTYRRYIEINTALERIGTEDELARSIIKTVGILSIINERSKLPSTEGVLGLALGTFSGQEQEALRRVLRGLVEKKVLLFRRHGGEYRIWEGSDIDLVSLLRHKKAEYEGHFDPVAFIASKFSAPAVLAHRHNEEFGINRHFDGLFVSFRDLDRLLGWDPAFHKFKEIDGQIYYVIADSQTEIDESVRRAREAQDHHQVLFAIPRKSLNLFEPLLELDCLEQLLADPSFVSQDPVLQRELGELADDCLSVAQRKLIRLIEPRYRETVWIYLGEVREEVTSQAGA